MLLQNSNLAPLMFDFRLFLKKKKNVLAKLKVECAEVAQSSRK